MKDLKGIRYVYSFNLDDVTRPGEMSPEVLNQITDHSADGNKMLEEYRAVELPDLWLIVDRSDSKVQWMDKEKALKITGKIAGVAFVDKHEKRKRLNFRHGYKNPRPHFCNRSTLIIHI